MKVRYGRSFTKLNRALSTWWSLAVLSYRLFDKDWWKQPAKLLCFKWCPIKKIKIKNLEILLHEMWATSQMLLFRNFMYSICIKILCSFADLCIVCFTQFECVSLDKVLLFISTVSPCLIMVKYFVWIVWIQEFCWHIYSDIFSSSTMWIQQPAVPLRKHNEWSEYSGLHV